MRLRPPLVRAALALTLALTGLAIAAPAQAAPALTYAALGDSYSSGTGAPPYDSSGCERSQRAYAPLWASANAVTSFRFVACSGAVTADVRNNQVSALDTSVNRVTITIGGNDAGFASVLTTCQLGSDSACATAVNNGKAFASNQLPARLDQTYAAIRSRAPSARLIVLGYPRIFELTSSCGLFGMSLYKRTVINSGADHLASVIAARAAAAGATYVDVRSAFAGHGVCAGSPWINGLTLNSSAYHPNANGYRYGYLAALTAAGV
ncbi:Lysophospholipase L1 [Micromonospora pattaloongensis]|uniref:Lysophospholipase L1 n=1 Tax=Micromonospora pattaloongensis TaxID=405436 RepID=A0A1H3Q7D6_9ACTN|nr:SGNH/GDSL hydrolase family protein [Micromonospora pattaloongensis]SDZ09081.1 Lysophospholipase L1 [Micromonospora pattaloongensis]